MPPPRSSSECELTGKLVKLEGDPASGGASGSGRAGQRKERRAGGNGAYFGRVDVHSNEVLDLRGDRVAQR
jgi:hypothetical protein